MHFGFFIQVGEPVQNPARYYENNVVNALNLLDPRELMSDPIDPPQE